MNGVFHFAKVLSFHPESNTVDVILMDNGATVQGARLVNGFPVSTNTGITDLPVPTTVPFADEVKLSGNRDILAVVANYWEQTICLGFVYPQVSQMLFQRDNFRVSRHASDWYTTVNEAGDFEAYHPSGSFVRIGESPDHEDLTGKDYDGKWKIAHNTDRKPHLHVLLANGGTTKLDLHADSDGNVSLVAAGKLDVNVTGDVSLETQGNVTATATGDVAVSTQGQATVTAATKLTVDTPMAHFTGDFQVDGDISDATGSMQTMRDQYNPHEHPDDGPPDVQMV